MTLGKRSAPTSIRLYERRMACSDGDGDQRSRKATAVPCIMPKTAGVAYLAGGRYCTVLSGAAIVSITTIAYVFWHCSCAAAKLSSADDGMYVSVAVYGYVYVRVSVYACVSAGRDVWPLIVSPGHRCYPGYWRHQPTAKGWRVSFCHTEAVQNRGRLQKQW